MSKIEHPEIRALLGLSARIGRDRLLVQASSGNTSVKVDNVMWIKASGKWLADSEQDEIFVPIDVDKARRDVECDSDVMGACTTASGLCLRASIETAMHAVLPQRVALHVHSVNTIAWAVRQDGFIQLSQRLNGLRWRWIRYVTSGLPLAREIQNCLNSSPGTDVFVLANHGLVVCGNTCNECEELLWEVERRLGIAPRKASESNCASLNRLISGTRWRLPACEAVQALATDEVSMRVVSSGVLYPCQAIFLGGAGTVVSPQEFEKRMMADDCKPFLIIEGWGVVVNETMRRAEGEMLIGLAEIIRRIDKLAPLRYLSATELEGVLTEDTQRYRQLAAINNMASMSV